MQTGPIKKDTPDFFDDIEVDKHALWGKQTQRSLTYFKIGKYCFEPVFIRTLVSIKKACADVNFAHGLLSKEQHIAIVKACDDIMTGTYDEQFPLRIWQTGSGTQTNMNVNEVIASIANRYLSGCSMVHPNDHVNCSQSTNDVFPSAMHMVVVRQSHSRLFPAIDGLLNALHLKQSEFNTVFSVARTHMMDALPIRADAILSGYYHQVGSARASLVEKMGALYSLALGGTAIGTGANAPARFGEQVIACLAEREQLPFTQHTNLYAAVSGEDALMGYSSALKQLAAVLLKIANDIRLLGSGPRCGLNEWILPSNEPGSSIMPGKVNPTQCEALSMVCLQVFGNDLTVSLAASNGQLQLNTYRPVIIHNLLESIGLLSDAMLSFSEYCLMGIRLNKEQINENMRKNLSVITLLTPVLGYEVAARIARTAETENISLGQAAEALALYSQRQFEALLQQQLKAYSSN